MAITPIKSPLTADQQRYAVESGIPVAPRKATSNEYPFLSMNVGDSFPLASGTLREFVRVRNAIHYWNRMHAPMKFVLRIHKPSGKHRCWRVV